MKAIIHDKFGSADFLHLREVEKPSPRKNEILLKIHAASVNAYDWRHVKADPYMIRFMGGGLNKPKHPILGADMAGVVVEVGSEVKGFKPGDAVFGEGGYGGFAEYACVASELFVPKPPTISFEQAAASPMAALTALQGLRDNGKIKAGQKVLVNGASGGVGSFAVQIAKMYGAEVTGVCSSSKMDFVKTLGSDYVIDYLKQDIIDGGTAYDLIYDVAAHHSTREIRKILNKDGEYVIAGGSISRIFQLMFKSIFGIKNMSVVMAKPGKVDMLMISKLMESGKIKSYIDKVYPLEETADAIRYLDEGKVKGKVVVSVTKEA